MPTITPILTGLHSGTSRGDTAGDGLSVFFWDPRYEFWAGGIGSSLGYTNYLGPLAFNSSTLQAVSPLRPNTKQKSEINGIPGAFVGIGLDVRGNFSTTADGKTGTTIYEINTTTNTVTSEQLTIQRPNTICVRMGSLSSYCVRSVSSNLNNYPLNIELSAANTYDEKYANSPGTSLHQVVSGRDQIVFKSVKVSLCNNGKTVKVDIKNPSDNKYYPYHYVDLEYGLGEGETYTKEATPTILRAGLCFSTSDAITNCELKNVVLHGKLVDYKKTFIPPSITPTLSTAYL